MTKRLSNFITKIKEYIYSKSATYIVVIALSAALLVVAWLVSDGESVPFVYNEF